MFSQESLSALEFYTVKKFLASYVTSVLGAESVEQLTPEIDKEKILQELQKVTECKNLIEEYGSIPLSGFRDIRDRLKIAAVEGSMLEVKDLVALKDFLTLLDNLIKYFKNKRDSIPLVGDEIVSRLNSFKEISKQLKKIINPNDEIDDHATEKLYEIRANYKNRYRKVEKKVSELCARHAKEFSLRDVNYTIRNDRFVMPVRIEHKTSVQGVIHDRSTSGITLFIEPLETVELNNNLKDLQLAERNEIISILRTMSSRLRPHVAELGEQIWLFGRLDFISAKAQMAIDYQGIRPEFNDHIKIIGGIHPLLIAHFAQNNPSVTFERKNAVPLDLAFGEHFTTLIISGPNMGGKTVALKTVGLLTVMAQAGLLIPAEEGTALKIFSSLYAVIGDEQSITEQVSTFSSHLAKIKTILENAAGNSLVLIDELCTGTDPEQGTALSITILEYLIKIRCVAVITTHYPGLKVFAHTTQGIQNGSMEFDEDKVTPTYRFKAGIPGSSFALEIAEQVGISKKFLERAKTLTDPKTQRVEDLVGDLHQTTLEHKKRVDSIKHKEHELQELVNDYEKRMESIKHGRENIVKMAYQEAKTIIDNANRIVETSIADIKAEQASRVSIRKSKQQINKLQEEIKQELTTMSSHKSKNSRTAPIKHIVPGKDVWITNLGIQGTVKSEINDGKAVLVQVNEKLIKLTPNQLAEVDEQMTTLASMRTPTLSLDKQEVNLDGISDELSVTGLTGDEAVAEVDRFLDKSILADLASLRIKHGIGSGTLKKRIHKLLTSHVHVKSFRECTLEEGGPGISFVELK